MAAKKLTVSTLPTVLIHTLALDARDLAEIAHQVNTGFAALVKTLDWYTRDSYVEGGAVKSRHQGVVRACDLPVIFSDILKLPHKTRAAFCSKFNDVLDELCAQDFFGTEGQLDPRGDHRD